MTPMPFFTRTRILGVAILAAAFLMYCNSTPARWKKPNLIDSSSRLQSLFEKAKTLCFGRLPMEIPASATVVWGRAEVPLDVEVIENEAETLDQKIAELETKLKSVESYPTSGGHSLYDETIAGAMPGQKMVLRGSGAAVVDRRYRIDLDDGRCIEGRSDAQGRTQLARTESLRIAAITVFDD